MPLACVELPPDELHERLEIYRLRARNRVPLFDDDRQQTVENEYQERFMCWGCGRLTPKRSKRPDLSQRRFPGTIPGWVVRPFLSTIHEVWCPDCAQLENSAEGLGFESQGSAWDGSGFHCNKPSALLEKVNADKA